MDKDRWINDGDVKELMGRMRVVAETWKCIESHSPLCTCSKMAAFVSARDIAWDALAMMEKLTGVRS